MKRIFTGALFLISLLTFGKTYYYEERTENNVEKYKVTRNGEDITAEWSNQIIKAKIGNDNSTSSYSINNSSENRHMDVYIKDEYLILNESKNRHEAGKGEWMQVLYFNDKFIKSNDKKKKLWFISGHFQEELEKSGEKIEKSELPIMDMVMKRSKKEILEINGKEVECRKVILTFDDMRSMMWKAKYWYRLEDGVLARIEMKRGGPGTPVTVTELVEEK